MTKDEYTEKLNEYVDDNDLEREDGLTYLDGIQDAAALARQLDEPEKVVIPQFGANLIEETTEFYGNDPLNIAYGIASSEDMDADCIDWLDDDDNQKLLLNAIANGYEVEKQKKYRVKIDSKLYFQRFENTEAVFLIDDSLGVKESSPVFTREVGNKILETLGVESGQLEEVEDD